jgi:predicted nuclease of predicted toxin-antitoxin system
MQFLIDNALSPKLAEMLRENGIEAVHVREIGLHAAPDIVIFDNAKNNGQIIVSADTDFSAILARLKSTTPSVILFRTSRKQTEYLFDLLTRTIGRFKSDLELGCVLVFDDRRVRVRMLPIMK